MPLVLYRVPSSWECLLFYTECHHLGSASCFIQSAIILGVPLVLYRVPTSWECLLFYTECHHLGSASCFIQSAIILGVPLVLYRVWKIVVIGSGGYRDARKSLVTLPQSTSICLLHKHLSRTTRTGTTPISYFINLK